jgi:hypothetical protein
MKYKDQLQVETAFKGAEISAAQWFAAAAFISIWAKPSLIPVTIAVTTASVFTYLRVFFWRKGNTFQGFEFLLSLTVMLFTIPYRSEARDWTSAFQLIFCAFIGKGVVGFVLSYWRRPVLNSWGFRDKFCPQNE